MVRLSGIIALSLLLLTSSVTVAQIFAPLDDLPLLKDYESKRASSSDLNWENGNGDCRPIQPGGTLTLAELQGPGKIVHIWFTIADNEKYYGKKLLLKMYWDGERLPSVEAPVNDFFCEGHGMDYTVDSLPFRVTSNGKGRNCYFAMPFKKSAKIVVTNEGKEPCHAFYYYIDWQKLPSLPQKTAYFHAKYRQEYPCVSGKDYLILDAAGKGHYVGCNLSVRMNEPGWWGEGDDRFYIDGEKVPSIQGTGSEDYFCDGWGLRKLDGLFYGVPLMEGYDTNNKTTAYRFHITDPVTFKKSLRVVIEHKGARLFPDGQWNGYVERADDFSSVAYWYQMEPHKEFYRIPSAEDRIYKSNSTLIEAESLVPTAVASEQERLLTQDLPGWSGGKQLFYTSANEKGYAAVKYPVQKAGRYQVDAVFTKSFDYGTYRALIDGNIAGRPFDLYNEDVVQAPAISLGVMELAQGEHELKFECVGKNTASAGYYFGLDYIELIPVVNQIK